MHATIFYCSASKGRYAQDSEFLIFANPRYLLATSTYQSGHTKERLTEKHVAESSEQRAPNREARSREHLAKRPHQRAEGRGQRAEKKHKERQKQRGLYSR